MNPNKDDIARASQEIGLSDAQIDRLWDALQQVQANKPKSGLLPSFLYLGGLIAFVSMTWFYTGDLADSHVLFISLLYALIFFGTGTYFWHVKKLKAPGGMLASLGVIMVPLIVYSLETVLDLWPQPLPFDYAGFYRWAHGNWVPMEICTLLVAFLTLYFIRFPFITLFIYGLVAFMSVDAILLLTSPQSNQRLYFCIASITIGSLINALAFNLYKKNLSNFGFWAYLAGMFFCWNGLTFLNIKTEWGYLMYLAVNILFILVANFFHRRIFLTFGYLGVVFYIGHIAYKMSDSPLFSFVLAAIGFATIILSSFLMRTNKRQPC